MQDSRGIERSSWQRKLTIGVAVVVVAVALWLIGAAVIPEWWAHRVGNVTNERLSVGILYGLFIGFVFTVAPGLVLWVAFRSRRSGRSWKTWAAWLVAAAVCAAPNLMTLGIVWGSGSAAHDGERILGTQANGFRLGSLIGAIAGGLAILGLMYLVRTRGWFRDENRRLRNDVESQRSR